MKRAIIGGFLALIGTTWVLPIIVIVGNNMFPGRFNLPGRFITSIYETGMTFPLIIASLLMIAGLLIMGIEYFRKEK